MTGDEVHVLVPGPHGSLDVCVLSQLVESLDEGLRLDDAAAGAAIDMIEPTSEALAKVRALNQTGDAAAYWA